MTLDKQTLSQALDRLRAAFRSGWSMAPVNQMEQDFVTALDAASLVPRLLPDKCGNCGGSGEVRQDDTKPLPHGVDVVFYPCPSCHGSGETWDAELVEAGGDSLVPHLPEDVQPYAYRFAETALRAIVETLKGEPK